MEQPTETASRLGPEGAFVVQLHSDAAVEQHRISGRIEHPMSGDSAPFTSFETILTFMAKHTGGGRGQGW